MAEELDENGNPINPPNLEVDKDGNPINPNPDPNPNPNPDENPNPNPNPVEVDYEKDSAPLIISKLLGEKILDSEGKEIQYEDSYEGTVQFVKDLIAKNAQTNSANVIKSFFESDPEIRDAYYYKIKNGSLNGYGQQRDYSKDEVSKDDKEQWKTLILEAEILRGADETRAKKLVTYSETQDSLEEDAKEALKFMRNKQKADRDAVEKQIKDQQDLDEQEANKYWTSFEEIIKKGKIKNYNLPEKILVKVDGKIFEKTRQDFYDYVATPRYELNGQLLSQYDRDLLEENKNRTIEDDVFDAYLKFVKGDMSQFIKQQINNEKVKSLKEKLSQTSRSSGGDNNTISRTTETIKM